MRTSRKSTFREGHRPAQLLTDGTKPELTESAKFRGQEDAARLTTFDANGVAAMEAIWEVSRADMEKALAQCGGSDAGSDCGKSSVSAAVSLHPQVYRAGCALAVVWAILSCNEGTM